MRNISRTRPFRFTPVVLASAALLVACGDPCTKSFDKLMACAPDEAKKEMEGKKEEAYDLVRRGLKADLRSHVCWHVYG